jgi:hypothetical protein
LEGGEGGVAFDGGGYAEGGEALQGREGIVAAAGEGLRGREMVEVAR